MKDTGRAQRENTTGQTEKEPAMKCAARWGHDTLSSTQHRLGFDPRGSTAPFAPRSPSYTQSSAQEAVPSGLSFSRNHFLKEKKKEEMTF